MYADFRIPLAAFSIFAGLVFVTGVILYAGKAGISTDENYEYYMGSEAARRQQPDRVDRFLAAKTTTGILKTQTPHSIGFAILFFILFHLLRSLHPAKSTGWFGLLFLLALLVDFAMPFCMLSGWSLFAALRFPFVCFFAACGIGGSAFLCVKVCWS